MSVYGKVKKVGSSTFQFDRVYSSRAQMEQAMAGDGVYAGRYALIEYGQRYTTTQEYENQPVTYYVNTNVPVYECRDFLNSKQADLTAYGAIYDSTVWQKIYTSEGDKYIMVAELNAVVPQLDLIKDSPLHYEVAADSTQVSKVYVVDESDEDGKIVSIKPVTNATETYNQAHFDEHVDTEASYQLHIPNNVELNINNENVNIHEHGFDIAYSFGTDDSQTAVGWVTDGLQTNNDGEITSASDKDSKTFYMNMPAFGNVMNDLYDLLYGKPQGDLTEGALRPYFEPYVGGTSSRTMKVMVKNSNNEWVPLQTNHTIAEYNADPDYVLYDCKTISGRIGESVPVHATSEEISDFVNEVPNNIRPNNIILALKHGDGTYEVLNTTENINTDDVFFAYNNSPITANDIISPIITNSGIADTDRSWMQGVPGLGELLVNNTAGLATILQSLFGYADPFTGTTRYYLYTDWQTEESDDSSLPAIQHKPEIVGGYNTVVVDRQNKYTTVEENVTSDDITTLTESLTTTDLTDWSSGDYDIDYNTWLIESYAAPVGTLSNVNNYIFAAMDEAVPQEESQNNNEEEPQNNNEEQSNSQEAEARFNLSKTYRTRNWTFIANYNISENKKVDNESGEYVWTVKISVTVDQDSFSKGGGWCENFYNYYRIGSDLQKEFITFDSSDRSTTFVKSLNYTLRSTAEDAYNNLIIPIYMIGYNSDVDGQNPSENDVVKFVVFKPTTTPTNESTNE